MLRTFFATGLIVISAGTLCAQATAEFEVATIKTAPPQTDGRTQSRMSSDTSTGRLTYSNVNLKDVIGKAYKIQRSQVTGPAWLDTERFDINAQFQKGAAGDQVPLMLQALLADRFKVKVHRDTKELPIYTLVVAKNGPKVKSTETESGITSNSNRTRWRIEAKVSMPKFAEFLTEQVGRPVVDKTGLMGWYDMTLDWNADNQTNVSDGGNGPSIFTALQEQLGLKLESGKGPVEALVVDHAEKTPTDN